MNLAGRVLLGRAPGRLLAERTSCIWFGGMADPTTANATCKPLVPRFPCTLRAAVVNGSHPTEPDTHPPMKTNRFLYEQEGKRCLLGAGVQEPSFSEPTARCN